MTHYELSFRESVNSCTRMDPFHILNRGRRHCALRASEWSSPACGERTSNSCSPASSWEHWNSYSHLLRASFAPSGLIQSFDLHPRLAPWAAFFRRFAAGPFQSSLARGVGIDFDVGAAIFFAALGCVVVVD